VGEPVLLKLQDDGEHGDGQPDDGIYGGHLLATEATDIYAARGQAEGDDSLGNPFTLFDNATFDVRPRVLYVYDTDQATALAFESLLEDNSLVVDLAVKGAVSGLNLQKYNLVIIGAETGDKFSRTWEPQAAIDAIAQNELPVLGLADGGGLYFDAFNPGLDIGWLDSAISSGTAINWNRLTNTDDIWRYPYEFSLPKEPLQLYESDSRRVDVHVGDQPTGVTIFGYNDNNQAYADLIMDEDFWMLWGFSEGPTAMTDTGRELFVNTVYRTLR
jgi:hypothetical protein